MNETRFSAEEKTKIYNFDYAVAMNRWSMRMIGLWPVDTGFSNFLCNISFTIMLICLLPPAAQLFATAKDLNSITNQIIRTVPFIPLMMRFILIKMQTKNLRVILNSMIIDWTNYRHLPEQCRQIMNYYARRGRLFTLTSIVFTTLSIIGYTLTPVMNTWLNNLPWNRTREYLPNEGFFPFPVQGSPTFELLYFLQASSLFLSGMVMTAVDCFLCIIVFHACGQFDVLATALQRYDCSFKHGCTQTRHTRSIVCACLPCIVKRHVHIINYMDIVERSFNVFIIIQIFGNCFDLAIEGYLFYMSFKSHDINGIITCIIYLITIAYNIVVYCWIGDCIIEKSDNIRTVAYNLEWYSFPRKHALSIILIMARSRRPCKITSGRFHTMSFSYYKTVLTTLFSYIYLLLTLNNFR
ncbi:ObirOr5-ZA1 [Ooceraea biroi]|uniref:Odorant receptor n=2 Tax=Ooceraea biroi TaxID=2015173 RepID=A0A026W5U8_OOCBI|nr:hypothetical protein X777_10602 [Ooceraea biroi]RLU17984.1 ObirOr5-ZA1 [Ooceraea biroi]